MNPILKRVLTGLTIGGLVIAAILFAPPIAFMPVVAALICLSICEYAALLNRKLPLKEMPAASLSALLVGSVILACGLWSLVRIGNLADGNLKLLYVVAIVKFSDVGGFAFGLTSAKLMKGGNHKLCPSISPGKSWEGLIGSVIVSSVVSCAFIGLTGFTVTKAIALGATAAIVGTFGDLIESKFKRWVGVKDSSTFKFTNGMGGILDMLDSLLIAPAILLRFL